jgi:hypothetical protein
MLVEHRSKIKVFNLFKKLRLLLPPPQLPEAPLRLALVPLLERQAEDLVRRDMRLPDLLHLRRIWLVRVKPHLLLAHIALPLVPVFYRTDYLLMLRCLDNRALAPWLVA